MSNKMDLKRTVGERDEHGIVLHSVPDRNEPDRDRGNGSTVLDRPPVLTPANKEGEKTEFPKQYHVWLINDDYTPHVVVVEVIREVFGFSAEEAERKMLGAHRTGRSLMGTFSKDIADTKASLVVEKTKEYGEFPLKADVEEAPSSS